MNNMNTPPPAGEFRPHVTCSHCGAEQSVPLVAAGGAPCAKCGSLSRVHHLQAGFSSKDLLGGSFALEGIRPSVTIDDGPVPKDTPVEVLRASRLRALIAVIEQLVDECDDDGRLALVSSEKLKRVLGFARRDKRDLEEGKI